MTSALALVGDATRLPLRDESVQLIFTSPPYNAAVAYDCYDDWRPFDEYWNCLIRPALAESYRVLSHGGRLALNMANVVRSDEQPMRQTSSRNGTGERRTAGERIKKTSTGKSFRTSLGQWPVMIDEYLWPTLRQIGFLPRERITWIKSRERDDEVITSSTAWGTWRSAQNPTLRACVEPIYVLCKGDYSREPGVSDLTAAEFKAWSRNAWFIPTSSQDPKARSRHPATFPLALARRVVKLFSYVGDTVLDPFCGSGTTIVAARQTGRVGIGCDISANYVRQAQGKAAQTVLELPMAEVERDAEAQLGLVL